MKKLDPQSVRKDFVDESQELMAYLGRARRALQGDEHEKGDISRLASTTFLSLFVYFEQFVSDLFLSYLNRDFSQYQKHIASRLDQSVEDKFGTWVRGRTTFNSVSHVKVDDLRDVVDPTGWNLTFKDGQAIKDRAQEWLVHDHAKRVNTLDDHDLRLVDTANSIRDFLAHGSLGAKVRMNNALDCVERNSNNQYLGRGAQQVHNVGAYLKSVFDEKRRIAIYSERLQEIARKM